MRQPRPGKSPTRSHQPRPRISGGRLQSWDQLVRPRSSARVDAVARAHSHTARCGEHSLPPLPLDQQGKAGTVAVVTPARSITSARPLDRILAGGEQSSHGRKLQRSHDARVPIPSRLATPEVELGPLRPLLFHLLLPCTAPLARTMPSFSKRSHHLIESLLLDFRGEIGPEALDVRNPVDHHVPGLPALGESFAG